MPAEKDLLGDTGHFKVARRIVDAEAYSIAEREGGDIGVTWHPTQKHPHGYPQAFGNQQWFILPDELAALVLASEKLLSSGKRST